MKPKVIRTVKQMKEWRTHQHESIGFVPTMGALHLGHAQLLKQCRQENELSVLSIYVNKTQFNQSSDFENYPNTWVTDLEIAESLGVNVVFAPTNEEMYPDQYRYKITENEFSTELCGAHRPGHFDGVLTVVMKLFNIINPRKAYFGEKDYQQLSLIQGMVKAYFMDVEIVPVPTIREQSGLAMSSRNLRLSAENKQRASMIYQKLSSGLSAQQIEQELREAGFSVDYVVDKGLRRFVAASIDGVRLIDNIAL